MSIEKTIQGLTDAIDNHADLLKELIELHKSGKIQTFDDVKTEVEKAAKPAPAAEVKKEEPKPEPVAEKPVVEEKKAEPTPQPSTALSLDDLRSKLMPVVQSPDHGPTKVSEVLGQFNVAKLSELEADQYPKFLAAVSELIGEEL